MSALLPSHQEAPRTGWTWHHPHHGQWPRRWPWLQTCQPPVWLQPPCPAGPDHPSAQERAHTQRRGVRQEGGLRRSQGPRLQCWDSGTMDVCHSHRCALLTTHAPSAQIVLYSSRGNKGATVCLGEVMAQDAWHRFTVVCTLQHCPPWTNCHRGIP